jgi:hypothetical protein
MMAMIIHVDNHGHHLIIKIIVKTGFLHRPPKANSIENIKKGGRQATKIRVNPPNPRHPRSHYSYEGRSRTNPKG